MVGRNENMVKFPKNRKFNHKGSFTYYVISRGGGGGFRNDYASVILIQ